LLALATAIWVVPTERASLGFSDAEIAFLFPAPIMRRNLVHFRLLTTLARSLVGALLMTLLSARWSFLGGNAVTHALGWWFVLSALQLHLSAARFTLTRLADLGLGVGGRRILILVAVAAVVAVAVARTPHSLAEAVRASDSDLRPVTAWLAAVAHTAPLSWMLLPFSLVLGPFLAPDGTAFLAALAPAAAVLAVHYFWVVRTALAFEDDTLAQAGRRAARLAAWRAGGGRIHYFPTSARRPPFALAPAGRPEIAFLWKNLLSTWPWLRARPWLAAAAVVAGATVALRTQSAAASVLAALAPLAFVAGVYVLLVGPQFARQDLRSDLAHADMLKTYPLAGWQIVAGQLLAPAAVLTGILWLLLLFVTLAAAPAADNAIWSGPAVRFAAALGLAFLLPLLAALQLLVPNAFALAFPAWFQATRGRGAGPEVLGQRLLFFFAQLVAMTLALAPAALVGAAALLSHLVIGPAPAVVLASSLVLVVLAAEVAAGVWWLGRRFERLDLSAELRS
jgi:hypothetical protein